MGGATVTESMVQQFGTNFRILGQQKKSRLEGWCQQEPNIVGTGKTVERLGATEAYNIVTRHGDTQYVQTPHSRRWLDLQDKGWADLVDEMDKIKMLADPTSPYAALGVAALNRAKDDIIIAAARGNARDNTANIALPAPQKIAVGATASPWRRSSPRRRSWTPRKWIRSSTTTARASRPGSWSSPRSR